MGTTDTALQAGEGACGFALLVEGLEYILTDAASMAPVITAYAGTGWTQALPGLKVVGGIKQSIEPFKKTLDTPQMTFHVMDDGSDTFGQIVWKSKPDIASRLTEVFQPDVDGSGLLTVRDNSNYDSSGDVFLGTRRITYSSKDGTTGLVVDPGGSSTYFPFSASGSNTFQRPQGLAEGVNFDVAAPPRLSTTPVTWRGKHVALYIHRIVNGVWDTRAQAHLEFAGTIKSIAEGEGGVTILTCVDLRERIEKTTLLREQFVGKVKAGCHLRAGDRFRFRAGDGTALPIDSGELTVVASGASGLDEIDQGTYSLADLVAKLNGWVGADSVIAGATLVVSFNTPDSGNGVRFEVRMGPDPSAYLVNFQSTSRHVMEFLGFGVPGKNGNWYSVHGTSDGDGHVLITAPNPPQLVRVIGERRFAGNISRYEIELDSFEGRFFDQGWAYYPNFLNEHASDPDDNQNYLDWSYWRIGDQLLLGRWNGTSKITNVILLESLGTSLTHARTNEIVNELNNMDVGIEDVVQVKQIVVLSGKFSKLIPALFYSLGGTEGVNHSDFDHLPWGAGIPASLLGDTFEQSCASLETATAADTITIMLDGPTRLGDVLIPEMMLRFAFLVWKDGVFQFVSPPTPNGSQAVAALTEANKAVGRGERVPMTSYEKSTEWLTNIVRVRHSRDGNGRYAAVREIVDKVSVDMHGDSEPLEIDAVNSSTADKGVSGSTVEHLAAELVTRVFPMFGYEVRILRRSIAPTLYHLAPGDVVTVSDDMVRDPVSGARRVSARAAIVLAASHDYGHERGQLSGEVTLLMGDDDTYPLSAAAEVDTSYTSGLYTDGYDSTNFRLKLKDHSFSEATAAKDVTWFGNDDVKIVELDPADPASFDYWARAITSVNSGTGYIQLNSAISSPAWSGATKKFVVIPQEYNAVSAGLRQRAYLGDDSDGHISGDVQPHVYGSANEISAFTRAAPTELPALLPTDLYAANHPLTPVHATYLARMVNNLVSYKTANHRPQMDYDLASTDATDYKVMRVFLFYVGAFQVAGRQRVISLAPRFRTTDAAEDAWVKITSSRLPPLGDSLYLRQPDVGNFRWQEWSSDDVGHTTGTAKDLLPVPADIPGHTWITVELKCSGGAECRLFGLPIFYLKPLEDL